MHCAPRSRKPQLRRQRAAVDLVRQAVRQPAQQIQPAVADVQAEVNLAVFPIQESVTTLERRLEGIDASGQQRHAQIVELLRRPAPMPVDATEQHRNLAEALTTLTVETRRFITDQEARTTRNVEVNRPPTRKQGMHA